MTNTLPDLDQSDLVVHLTRDSGALSRLMSTLRRRGFTLDTISAKRLDGGGYQVKLRFDTLDRDISKLEALARQIRNLIDVQTVQVVEPKAEPIISVATAATT